MSFFSTLFYLIVYLTTLGKKCCKISVLLYCLFYFLKIVTASCEIPEWELLKDVIYAFQGIDGKWIKFDSTRDGYRIDYKVSFNTNSSSFATGLVP